MPPRCSHLEDAKNHLIFVPSLSDDPPAITFDEPMVVSMSVVDMSQSDHPVARVTPTGR